MLLLLSASLPLLAADAPLDILEAARTGKEKVVAALLAKGVDIESRNKEGKTPLMLAAEYGRTSTVKLLLEKGAKADARDAQHWNAYMLALLQPSGGIIRKHDPVLKLLPQPKRFRLAVTAGWTPGQALFSSCFMGPEDLMQHMRQLHPDGMVIEALQHFAIKSGHDMIAIVSADARGRSDVSERPVPKDVDAVLTLRVEPGATCVQRFDRLSMLIQATLNPPESETALLEKSFGEGLKYGVRGLAATNPNQHGPIYEDWAKSQAGAIYWAVLTALLIG
ncbi:MAG: ankyrin repeat domain-containing protein [Candidatus Solibacter sp.]